MTQFASAISPAVYDSFWSVGQGKNPNAIPGNDTRARRSTFYHIVNYPAAGATTLNFFNASYQPGITNLPQAGFAPADYPFWLTGISCSPQLGLTLAGARDADSNPYAASGVPGTVLNEVATLFKAAYVQLKIGDYVVYDGHGLDMIPAAGGIKADVAAAATTVTIANIQNGEPLANNMFSENPWYPVLPQRPIQMTVNWLTPLTLTNFDLPIKICLHGIAVTPGKY